MILALFMARHLPLLQPEKWRRYPFESKDRYYTIILQQDLFHQWSIIQCYGGKDNNLGNIVGTFVKTQNQTL